MLRTLVLFVALCSLSSISAANFRKQNNEKEKLYHLQNTFNELYSDFTKSKNSYFNVRTICDNKPDTVTNLKNELFLKLGDAKDKEICYGIIAKGIRYMQADSVWKDKKKLMDKCDKMEKLEKISVSMTYLQKMVNEVIRENKVLQFEKTTKDLTRYRNDTLKPFMKSIKDLEKSFKALNMESITEYLKKQKKIIEKNLNNHACIPK